MSSLNILVIETETFSCLHISRVFNSLGFENINFVKSIDDAFSFASTSRVDILFTNVTIHSYTDGIETAYSLQQLYKMPIIFLSQSKDIKILKSVAKVEFMGFLVEPYRDVDLEALISIAKEKLTLKKEENLIRYKNYSFDKNNNKFLFKEQTITLSKKEKLFIKLLFSNLNSIISYDILDKTIWFNSCVSDNTRRTFIYRIKNKFNELEICVEKNIGIKLVL